MEDTKVTPLMHYAACSKCGAAMHERNADLQWCSGKCYDEWHADKARAKESKQLKLVEENS